MVTKLQAVTAALLLLIATSGLDAQQIEEVFRHSGCATGVDQSLIRVSRYGVTACIKSTFSDSNTVIFYKTIDGSGTLNVGKRWVTQAVVVDSLMYVSINRRGKRDSAFASVSMRSGAWRFYPNGSGIAGTGRTISCVGENIIGYEQQVGPSRITPGDSVSTRVLTSWMPGANHSLCEVFGVDSGSVILLNATGVARAMPGSSYLQSHRPVDGQISCAGFLGSEVFNATEIGDSVYWATSCGTAALSVATGDYRWRKNEAPGPKSTGGAIAGKRGSLHLNEINSRMTPMTMTYYSLSSDSTIVYHFPESSDTTAVASGGGWWDGRFYVAITTGNCRETVVYSISEPELPTSVEDGPFMSGGCNGSSTSIAIDAAAFNDWLQRLSTEAVVYDIHGRLVNHRSISSGAFRVLAGARSYLVVVVR